MGGPTPKESPGQRITVLHGDKGYGTYDHEWSDTEHLPVSGGHRMAKEVSILLKVFLDFICILVVGLPILILHLAGIPYLRGLNCDDETIRYPFRESTISNVTLYCAGILVPLSVIVLTESILFCKRKKAEFPRQRIFLRWNVHPLLWELYVKIGIFAFGACLCQMTTDIAKYSIGRLRPHFWEICDPNVDCVKNPSAYIIDFQCNSGKTVLIREARLSFLSGHASFSAFTMVYVVLYLQSRMVFRGFKLLRPFLQALALYAAWFTALSRISDYKHHWSDVLAGSVQGTLVCLLVVFFISDLFPRKKESENNKYVIPSSEFAACHPADNHKCESEQCS